MREWFLLRFIQSYTRSCSYKRRDSNWSLLQIGVWQNSHAPNFVICMEQIRILMEAILSFIVKSISVNLCFTKRFPLHFVNGRGNIWLLFCWLHSNSYPSSSHDAYSHSSSYKYFSSSLGTSYFELKPSCFISWLSFKASLS